MNIPFHPAVRCGLLQARWGVAAIAAILIAIATPLTAHAWDAPVPVLHWHPCTTPGQEGFDCATAQVPLDYSDPLGETIELAVIRHNATDPAKRIGSIFFNPGGPGAPGTQTLPFLFSSKSVPPIVFPTAVRERFDIISWDTRGVGASTAVLCFDDDRTKNAEDEANFLAPLPVGVPYTLAQKLAWIKGYAELGQHCEARNSKLLKHVSTTDSARDLDLLRQAVGEKQMNYQGNSYGTFLGDVYANLFPDKVRALVLEGNVNAPAWATWDGQPGIDLYLRQEADNGSAKTLDAFLNHCGEVSTTHCAFSAGTAATTQEKWATLLKQVRKSPVTIDGAVWNYDYTVTLTIATIYEVQAWPEIACQLQQVWQNGTPACPPPPPATGGYTQVASQAFAIRCGEAPNPTDPSDYFALEDLAFLRSGVVGPYWTWQDEECAAWPGKAAEHYMGPWNQPTANPILLVNTLSDPATPYQSAVAMSKTLANARLLTIDGYGHADGGTPSTCANTYISDYFINGTLPAEGTVCHQDKAPFSTIP